MKQGHRPSQRIYLLFYRDFFQSWVISFCLALKKPDEDKSSSLTSVPLCRIPAQQDFKFMQKTNFSRCNPETFYS